MRTDLRWTALVLLIHLPLTYVQGDLTSLAPHERLPEILVVGVVQGPECCARVVTLQSALLSAGWGQMPTEGRQPAPKRRGSLGFLPPLG